MGGSANDPRWRENGGSWGYRTPEAAAGAGGGSNMSAYSQQAFGMPQAGHERTANQRRADRSAAFNRMHGGSQQAAPMAAYSPQQSAPQSGMQAWGQQSGQRMAPHQGNLTVMVPEQSGGPGRAQAPTGSRDAEGRRWTEDGRLLKNDPREEMQRLQQTRVGDGSASAWDHPQNAAVRARVERQIQEYDNDPYDQLAYFTQGAASPGQPGRAQSIQPQSQGTPYTPPAANSMILGRPNSARSAGPVAPSQPNTPRPFGPPTSGGQQGPRPSNSAFADAWNFSMEGNASRMAPARTFGGGGAGNLAYMPDNARPDPFTSYAIGPDGRQVSQQQSLNNRDALISALIQDNAQHAGRSGVYQGRGNPPPGFMAPPPPPNIPALWGQAQNAVNNGWVSPAAGLWG
jgi:hypothetical protein